MFTGLIVVVLAVVLAIGLHRRVIAGYPPAPAGLAVLDPREAAFVDAVAEVLFPAGGGGLAVSGLEAALPLYIDRHLASLPRAQRVQIRLLFGFVEHLTIVIPGDEPGGRRRFSSLSAASRVSVLERMARHPSGPMRLLFTALRSVFVLAYLGHPGNLRGLGLAPFEIEPVASDAELLFPRIGALMSSVDLGVEDYSFDEARDPLEPNGPRHRAYTHRPTDRSAG